MSIARNYHNLLLQKLKILRILYNKLHEIDQNNSFLDTNLQILL
jgi:hypothetical protein